MLVICHHRVIYTCELSDSDRKDYVVIICKQCKSELGRWKKCEEGKICFEELFFQRIYVFGPVPQFSWSVKHELR